jgi:hypothetical protein
MWIHNNAVILLAKSPSKLNIPNAKLRNKGLNLFFYLQSFWYNISFCEGGVILTETSYTLLGTQNAQRIMRDMLT